ncbi:MAG TPA: TonB-dependent receptor [Usitatibacteraceae bacterium]|nr:TonB-dependent receptor [Usitatibacteraceae bacterium]
MTRIAQLVALTLVAGPALAQQTQDPKKVEKIEVTGSSIKRVQTEGALPLQVITRESIQRAGIHSAEQLMDYISANGNGAENLSSQTLIAGATDVEGRNNSGNASANLRGMGAGSTLVLLNGRRQALHGMKSGSVDLNSIPLSAVERVEILKDGASAIYGTDAIGGVINFILRKDYEGAEVSATADVTEGGGGNRYRGSVLAGKGNFSKDGWNVMAALSFSRQEALRSEDRDFSNGYQPNRGLSPDTVGSPFATQITGTGTALGTSFRLPGDTQAYTRANLLSFLGNCDDRPNQSQYESALWATPSFRFACAFDYTGVRVLIQPVDNTNFVGRGMLEINPSLRLVTELTASRSRSKNEFEQRQIGAGLLYPVNGPYYQDLSAYIPTFNRNLPIAYRWRCMECGPRVIGLESEASRLLVGLEGEFKGWDWKTGVSSGRSWANSTLISGYYFTTPFNALMNSGIVNPWLMPGQTQTQAALDGLAAASASGAKWLGGKTGLTQFDAVLSGELFRLPAGTVSMAAGFDFRRETYNFGGDQPAIADAPNDVNVNKVSREVKALYAEFAVPILKSLETQIAVRRDDYSDFGSTTNPKVSFAWRPLDRVMFRGSWSEGFRAPTFIQLYSPELEGPVPGNIADPVLCPQNPGNPAFCAIRPLARTGGNANLQPETSKQWNVGIILEPTNWFSASLDYWKVDRKDLIFRLTPQEVVANFTQFPNDIVRNPDGTINYIRAGLVNAANEVTKGVEVGLRADWNALSGKWRANLEGTYVDSYKTRVFETQAFTELVGEWSRRTLHPKWKHTASVNYTRGPWSTTLTQRYVHSYKDEVPNAGASWPGFDPKVDAYVVHDIAVAYSGFKNLTLRGGIRNIVDEDPPFTAHMTDFVSGAGWDPRVADPRGRAYWLTATYSFK